MAGSRASAALAMVLGLAVSGCGESPYEVIAAGNSLYEAGDYEAAAARYQAAATVLPDLAALRFNQANAAYRQRAYNRAEELYTLALQTEDLSLLSRIKYNLGRLKHGAAIDAMLTFHDAVAPLRAAITFYRSSLEQDPGNQDALYNLELARRLMNELERQRVQAQRNPEVRNQETSENQGQPFDEIAPDPTSTEREAGADAEQKPQGGEAQKGPRSDAGASNSTQSQQGMTPRPMSPEEAQQMVEIIRGRAGSTQNLREQWRRARMREPGTAKDW